MPLSNPQKLIVLRLIEERKKELFGSFKEKQRGNALKEKLWKEIVKKCASEHGFDATNGKNDWKYLRDTIWTNWKRETKTKVDENRKTGNEGGDECRLTEVNEAVLNIIGRESASLIGLSAPEQWTNGGRDAFAVDDGAVSIEHRRDSVMTDWTTDGGDDGTSWLVNNSGMRQPTTVRLVDRSNTSTQVVIGNCGGERSIFLDNRQMSIATSVQRSVSPIFASRTPLSQIESSDTRDHAPPIFESSGLAPPKSPQPQAAKKTPKPKKRPVPVPSPSESSTSEDLRGERIKNLRLHNTLMEIQIDYLKLKMQILKDQNNLS